MSEEKSPWPARYKLTVTLLKAKDLPVSDLLSHGGAADPYVIFRIGDEERESKVEKNTLNPNWGGQCFDFEVKGGAKLICTVVDKDQLSSDDKIGTVVIDSAEFPLLSDKVKDFQIYGKNKQERGWLTLKFHVQSVGGKDKRRLQDSVKQLIEQCKAFGVYPPRKAVDQMTIMELLHHDETLSKTCKEQQRAGGGAVTDDEREELFIKRLKDLGVEIVVFDMDRTACKLHSGGVLQMAKVPAYIANASEDFTRITPKLIANGFKMAIATFTDEIYYERFPRLRHRAGSDLVQEFLNGVFKDEKIGGKKIVDAFEIVAYFPDLHDEDKAKSNKSYHIGKIMKKYDVVDKRKVILFDDTLKNIEAAKNEVHAYKANPRVGFKLEDLLNA